MKFGVCIPHYGRPIEANSLTEMAVKAEEMGFDSVWVTDHIIVPDALPDRPPEIVYRHDMLEPITLLAHLGAVTERVNIGTSVIILPYRNPVILAKAIATADLLSSGRVIFGAAVGWMEGEFAALNADFKDRGLVSDEYLRLLRELWTNPRPTFDGVNFRFSDVTFSPMPVQKPHPPIWIGGRSRAGARRAARYGDYWHPVQIPADEVKAKAVYMQEYCQRIGRETPPQLSFRCNLRIEDRKVTGDRGALQGTVEDIIGDVADYAGAGVSHIIMEIPGESFNDKFRNMERFQEEIVPNVSSHA